MNTTIVIVVGVIVLIIVIVSLAWQSATFKAYDQGFRDGRLDQHRHQQNVQYKAKRR